MNLSDIVGQETSIARLTAFGDFYRKNGSTLEHVLIFAEDGMGKQTIASAFANELGVPWQHISPSQVQIRGDLTAILTNLRSGELLILSDVHRLKGNIQEPLLEALKTRKLTIVLGQGSGARRHSLELPPFTVVATASRKSECADELLGCFSLVLPLQPYTNDALEKIVDKIAVVNNIEIDSDGRRLIATNSGGHPQQIEVLMQRVVRAVKKQKISRDDTLQALTAFGMRVRTDAQPDCTASLELLSGVDFEKLVMALLVRMEFRAEMTRATGDGGIDIVAILEKPIVGGKYLFQCKRYARENLVGASTVRDFYGAVSADKAVKGILITTSDFTVQAQEFAERVGLELINLPKLRSLLADHGVAAAQSV